MKALSIRQPWAWLICEGQKDVENRYWMSAHRGLLLIHASNTFDEAGYKWVRENFHLPGMPIAQQFQRGGIVGQVKMVDCVVHYESSWFFGPVGFVFSERRSGPLVKCRGMPGMFTAPDDLVSDYYPVKS